MAKGDVEVVDVYRERHAGVHKRSQRRIMRHTAAGAVPSTIVAAAAAAARATPSSDRASTVSGTAAPPVGAPTTAGEWLRNCRRIDGRVVVG